MGDRWHATVSNRQQHTYTRTQHHSWSCVPVTKTCTDSSVDLSWCTGISRMPAFPNKHVCVTKHILCCPTSEAAPVHHTTWACCRHLSHPRQQRLPLMKVNGIPNAACMLLACPFALFWPVAASHLSNSRLPQPLSSLTTTGTVVQAASQHQPPQCKSSNNWLSWLLDVLSIERDEPDPSRYQYNTGSISIQYGQHFNTTCCSLCLKRLR